MRSATRPRLKNNASELFKPRAVEHVEVVDLRSHDRNARTHSARQIQQIARSIERFGFNNPVLIDRNNQIIAGHGRVAAAKLLGCISVPALRIEHLSDAEKRAFIIADNKLAEKAGWDNDILAIEFQGLDELGFDLELTGFELPEIEMILDWRKTLLRLRTILSPIL